MAEHQPDAAPGTPESGLGGGAAVIRLRPEGEKRQACPRRHGGEGGGRRQGDRVPAPPQLGRDGEERQDISVAADGNG